MAEKGRIKGIKDGTGGNITDKAGNDLEFVTVFTTQLCLNEGDMVRFDRIVVNGKEMASNVVRSTIGVIASINDDNTTGTITEREPNPKRFGVAGKAEPIPFYEPFLKEQGLIVGDPVHYQLVLSDKGEQFAVNVQEN